MQAIYGCCSQLHPIKIINHSFSTEYLENDYFLKNHDRNPHSLPTEIFIVEIGIALRL